MVNATSCQLLRPMVEAFWKLGIHTEEGMKQESVPVIIDLAWQNHEFRLIDYGQLKSLFDTPRKGDYSAHAKYDISAPHVGRTAHSAKIYQNFDHGLRYY